MAVLLVFCLFLGWFWGGFGGIQWRLLWLGVARMLIVDTCVTIGNTLFFFLGVSEVCLFGLVGLALKMKELFLWDFWLVMP